MSLKKKPSSSANTLRNKAEAALKITSTQVKKMSVPEIQRLVHELQVHQIELEMQNEELRQMQLELQQARDRYADLYDFAPVGFLSLNTRGQILEANFPVCQLLGVDRKALLRQKFEKFVMATDQPILRQHLHHVEKGRTKEISDVIRLKHNASVCFVRLESLHEDSGIQSLDNQFRIAVIDLTEQEQTKALQKEQAVWVNAMLDTAMDAIIMIDDHQNIVLFNASAERMFGCTSAQALGKSVDRFIPQRLRKAHATHIREFERNASAKSRMGKSGEVIGLRANGEEFPLEAWISKVRLENGVRFTVILRDITERAEARKSLVASESEHRSLAQVNLSILNAISSHIALVDANGVIVSVNEAWKRFATANALKGANYSIGCNYLTVCDQAHGDCAEEGRVVADGLRAVLAGTQKSFALEYPCHAPDEERWFRVMITPISETEKAGAVVMHLNVTESRRVEESLEKEKQFISTILDTVGALVVLLDPEWRIIRFNQVCEKMIGRTFEVMRGKSFLDLTVVSGEDASEVKNLRTSYKGKQFPVFFESAWLNYDRQPRWISWSNTVIRDKQGNIENIIATGIDITGRKQAEMTMQRLATQNRLILDSAGEGIYGIDTQGKTTFFNRAAEKFTGWKSEEVEGRVLHTLLHHTRQDGTPYPWDECPVYSSINNGSYHQVETEILWRKEGTSFPVAYICSPIRGHNNKIEGVVVTFKDITEQKKAEEALRESEERFQAFMDHSPVVAFLKNEKGQYVYVNRQFEEKLHLPVTNCLGNTDSQLFPPEVARIFKEHDSEVLKNSEVL
jgi:PAS domain S-box-containing protein